MIVFLDASPCTPSLPPPSNFPLFLQIPGAPFVLVGTHSDDLLAEDKRSGQARRVIETLTSRTAQYTKVFKEELANIE